jgi:hypothetical protein
VAPDGSGHSGIIINHRDLPRAAAPYGIVQLRQDNARGTLYNMVGFQTRSLQGEQKRIFRPIRGWNGPNSRGSAACTATPSSTATTARQPVAPQGDAAATLHRPDHRRRRLCRKRRDWPSGPAALALRYNGVLATPSTGHDRARRLAAPYNQRRRCHHLPADDRARHSKEYRVGRRDRRRSFRADSRRFGEKSTSGPMLSGTCGRSKVNDAGTSHNPARAGARAAPPQNRAFSRWSSS